MGILPRSHKKCQVNLILVCREHTDRYLSEQINEGTVNSMKVELKAENSKNEMSDILHYKEKI